MQSPANYGRVRPDAITCHDVAQIFSLAQQLESFAVQDHPTYAKVLDALVHYVRGAENVIGMAKERDLLALFRGRG